MANQEQELNQQIWWLLQVLNNFRLLSPGQEMFFDTLEREEVPAAQQRLLLYKLAAVGAVGYKADIWQSDGIAMLTATASGKAYEPRRYIVRFLPDFEKVYKRYVSIIDGAGIKPSGEVIYNNGTIKQGSASVSFRSNEQKLLLKVLWPKREIVDANNVVIKAGTPLAKHVLADVEVKVSKDRLKNLIDNFNSQMRAKQINATISASDKVMLTVEGNT